MDLSLCCQGYDFWIKPHGINLSGGQRQRIALARILLYNPKIIILDEASVYLKSTYLPATIIDKDIINKKVKGRIIVEKKRYMNCCFNTIK